jgi:hypothetical protein
MAKKVEEVKEFPKVFVTEDGQELIARDDIQEAAFKNAGLKVKE